MPEVTIPAARRLRPLTRALNECRAAGIPAYCIAAEANISPAYLSMLSSGRVSPTATVAEDIAKAMGRRVGQLFPEL